MFLGFPGSGKTYFATRLAEQLAAVTINSDAMRFQMFGSLEKIEHIRETDRSRLYDDVFGAMDYAAGQVLSAGHSVIYDAQMTKRRDRQHIEALASKSGAVPILVWVKTPREAAIARGQDREARVDSHPYSLEKITMLVDRFERVTDIPESDENLIEISGEKPFEEQYKTFIAYTKNL